MVYGQNTPSNDLLSSHQLQITFIALMLREWEIVSLRTDESTSKNEKGRYKARRDE